MSAPSISPAGLAGRHGLELDAASVRVEEAGLDYRVAFARDIEGVEWVLRIPRRPDVSAKLVEEQRILAFVAPRLSMAVPRWEVCSEELIAYRRLPGSPGLTLDGSGQPRWPPTSTPAASRAPISPSAAPRSRPPLPWSTACSRCKPAIRNIAPPPPRCCYPRNDRRPYPARTRRAGAVPLFSKLLVPTPPVQCFKVRRVRGPDVRRAIIGFLLVPPTTGAPLTIFRSPDDTGVVTSPVVRVLELDGVRYIATRNSVYAMTSIPRVADSPREERRLLEPQAGDDLIDASRR